MLYAWRSFEAYPLLADLAGAASVRVPLRDQAHDLAAMAAAITDRTRLIFVCNPNNPTGTVVHGAELERFLDRVPPTAWSSWTRPTTSTCATRTCPDGISLYRDRPNVAVLRTFSKAYGLAGLRVGFLVAHEPVAAAARKTMLPFTVNAVAQAAAIASLAAEAELLERVDAVVKERGRVRDELLARAGRCRPPRPTSSGCRSATTPPDFAAACERAGVSVRPFGAEGSRISIGDLAANDDCSWRLAAALAVGAADDRQPPAPRRPAGVSIRRAAADAVS